MARNFSSGETKNVINEHRRLLNILNAARSATWSFPKCVPAVRP